MHLGSLYAAAASYLDARVHGGRWLLRLEDLDALREAPGASDRILRTLEQFGFEWDGAVIRQSARLDLYQAALERLGARGLTFACGCSRAMLPDDGRYPGTCRQARLTRTAAAIRLKVEPEIITFLDRIQGGYREDVAATVGDVILKRRDGIFSYLLSVVIDDAAQGVTHVVRGGDLFDNTPRQIYLQRALDLPRPHYAHVPMLVDGEEKLSKSRRSLAVGAGQVVPQLVSVFGLLGMPAPEREFASSAEAWRWAIGAFVADKVPRRANLRVIA